jgi:O-antigen ligase
LPDAISPVDDTVTVRRPEPSQAGLSSRRPRAGNRDVLRVYNVTAGYLLFQTIGASSAIDRLIYGEWDSKSGDKLTQLLNLAGIAAALALFVHGIRKFRHIDTGAWLLLSLAVFLTVSTVWSIDPSFTARRGVLYIVFVLGTIGMSKCFGGDGFIRLFGNVLFLSAILSVVFFAISPETALMQGGELRGVFSHKSVLGQAMATGALLALYRIRVDRGRRALGFVMLAVFVGVTIAARSMTSLLAIAAFCGVETVIALIRRGGAARYAGIAMGLVFPLVLAVAVLFPDQLLEMLGKDPTLTGRSELWEFVSQAIAQRPLLGWGLLAFWSPNNPAAAAISNALGWTVPQAHNGMLEMLLDVGIVGTCFFVLLSLRNVWLALRCLSTPLRDVAISLLMCCGGIVLVGMTEAVLVDPAQPAANMLFVVGLICERTLRTARQPRMRMGGAAGLANKQGVLF